MHTCAVWCMYGLLHVLDETQTIWPDSACAKKGGFLQGQFDYPEDRVL